MKLMVAAYIHAICAIAAKVLLISAQGESNVSPLKIDARPGSEHEKASGLPAKAPKVLIWSGKATRESSCALQ